MTQWRTWTRRSRRWWPLPGRRRPAAQGGPAGKPLGDGEVLVRGGADRAQPPGYHQVLEPGQRAGGTTSAPGKARAGGPGTAAPTSGRCWSRPPGQWSGYLADCKPGSIGWSASSAGPRTRHAEAAITAIAHTLFKIAYTVLKSGEPCQDLGADLYIRRESAEAKQAYLMRKLQELNPGCVITITPAEAA